MISPEIENRIIKFVGKSANAEDLHALEKWIREPQNHSIFKEFVKTHFAITMSMNDPDSSEIRKRLLKEIRNEKRLRFGQSIRSVMKYAAIVVFILGLGYVFKDRLLDLNSDKVIIPKEEDITLQLEDGNIKVIKEDGISEISDSEGNVVGTQQGSKMVYDSGAPIEELVYNTLKVPHGKRFDLVLSDGTHIFLNAGTSLRYPIKFIEGEQRKVFLEGEAYFDVVKNEVHPFVVNAQALDVKVLGTKFNVATYEEDAKSEVVLVEGSVAMNAENTPLESEGTILKPGFKGSFDKSQKSITTQKVNISLYTSWISGNVIFRNASFENIAKKLERLYNVTIINNNEQLANESFNANIEVDNETIEEVLNYFNKVYQIEYTIVNNKIVIN